MLHLMRRGIKRLGNTTPRARRQPITTPVLFNLLEAVRQSQSLRYHDQRMIAAAFTMAFFGFLRVSEFTVPTLKAFNPPICSKYPLVKKLLPVPPQTFQNRPVLQRSYPALPPIAQ